MFKYHMTPTEGFAQSVRVPSYGGRGCLFCSIYGICGERGLVENVIWRDGLAENVRIPSYRGRGSKDHHMIFERSLREHTNII